MSRLRSLGVSRTALAVLVAMALAVLLQAVEVALAQVWLFGALAAVLYALEWLIAQRLSALTKVLSRIRAGLTVRVMTRQVLLLALYASLGAVATTSFWWSLGGIVAFFALTLCYDLARLDVLKRARRPVETGNIDLSALGLPRVPRVIHALPMNRVYLADLPLLAGGVGYLAGGPTALAAVGAALSVGAAAAALAVVTHVLVAHLRGPSDDEVVEAVNERLRDLRPDVVLYFSFGSVGTQNAAYQANMWLRALERLDRPALVILRERGNLRHLDPTPLPVVCATRPDDLAALDLSSVRVALYPGNVGKNIHLIQRAEIKHVFVGHGDSDKLPSSNRVSRIFDEIWVAGRGGRDRYQRVRHAIDDHDVVEVGRPQLVEVEGHRSPAERAVPTVIYAPTWEGVDDDNYLTSADTVGLELVDRLLNQADPVRVIYKPHPLLGRRSPKAAEAHRRITALVEEANARLEPLDAGALAEADGLRRRIEEFHAEAGRRHLGPDDLAGHRARIARWHELHWASGGPLRHHVVTDTMPSLFSCFNQADVMVSDISSVVADFVASGKPYAVADLWDLGDDEFRLQYPSAGAGYVLRPGLEGLDTVLSAAREPETDALAARRRVLKEYLLGPDEPDAQTRFAAAVDDLYERAVRDFPLGTIAHPVPADPFTDPGAVRADRAPAS